ncbi:MAG: DUF1015 family protein [Nitrospiraceae bacterium]|nr:DUF1015 family protein [Nitrospiraceae bacterium]
MAIVLPFRGIRYNLERARDMAHLIAPPYDVVDDEERDRLVSINPYNIFSLELPKAESCGTHEVDRYSCAKMEFKDWLSRKILVQEDRPAIYPYDISFSTPDGKFCRKGFVALIHIEDWEDRIIRPHEQTFNKVIEDRFRLLKATKAQFSQIFLLYRHSPDVARILAESQREEICAVRDEVGNTHRFWKITGREDLRSLQEGLSETVLYIADGHHRYTTAMRYQKEMQGLYGKGLSMPYNYLMAYLVDAEDPGQIVLPVHRILSLPEAPDLKAIESAASPIFDVEMISKKGNLGPRQLCTELSRRLAESPERRGLGLVSEEGRSAQIWWLKAMDQNGSSSCSDLVMSKLDVILLQEAIIKGILQLDPQDLEKKKAIKYTVDLAGAIEALGERDLLFVLRPTPVEQVLEIADKRLILPHKSTYFYPKILTGMVINSVDKDRDPVVI